MVGIFLFLVIAVGINLVMFFPAYILKTDKLTDLSYSMTFIILMVIALAQSQFSGLKFVLALMVVLWALRLGIFLLIRIRKITHDSRFDGIRESFPGFMKFWVLQGLAVWIILLPALFFIQSNSETVFWPGIAVWALGLAVESLADLQKYRFSRDKSNKDKFINEGLWKYSRHPNYFGEILCWVGVYLFAFISFSPTQRLLALASPVFITVLLLFVTGLPALEKKADAKWGKQRNYIDYKRKTSVIIPWIPGK